LETSKLKTEKEEEEEVFQLLAMKTPITEAKSIVDLTKNSITGTESFTALNFASDVHQKHNKD
jgi:hypothetical protein